MPALGAMEADDGDATAGATGPDGMEVAGAIGAALFTAAGAPAGSAELPEQRTMAIARTTMAPPAAKGAHFGKRLRARALLGAWLRGAALGAVIAVSSATTTARAFA